MRNKIDSIFFIFLKYCFLSPKHKSHQSVFTNNIMNEKYYLSNKMGWCEYIKKKAHKKNKLTE